jgi:hypothetical protein
MSDADNRNLDDDLSRNNADPDREHIAGAADRLRQQFDGTTLLRSQRNHNRVLCHRFSVAACRRGDYNCFRKRRRDKVDENLELHILDDRVRRRRRVTAEYSGERPVTWRGPEPAPCYSALPADSPDRLPV